MKCARFFESQKIVHISNPNKSEIDAKLDYFQKNPTSFKKTFFATTLIEWLQKQLDFQLELYYFIRK